MIASLVLHERGTADEPLRPEIRDAVYSNVTHLVSTDYRWRRSGSSGLESEFRLKRNGSLFSISRKDVSPLIEDGREFPLLNSRWVFDGNRYREFRQKTGRLIVSDNRPPTGGTDPFALLFGWLTYGQCVPATWENLLSKQLWDTRFENAEYVQDEVIDGLSCSVVRFPQECGSEAMEYRVFFSRDHGFFPVGYDRVLVRTGEISTTVRAVELEEFPSGDITVWFPLLIRSSELGLDGSYIEESEYRIDRTTVDLFASHSPKAFQIDESEVKRVRDVQENKRESETLQRATALRRTPFVEEQPLNWLWIVNSAGILSLAAVFWYYRSRSYIITMQKHISKLLIVGLVGLVGFNAWWFAWHPQIQIPNEIVRIPPGSRVEEQIATFTIQNSGRANLEIDSVVPSCGCASVSLMSNAIEAGGFTTMDVRIEKTTNTHIPIVIRSNDPDMPNKTVMVMIDPSGPFQTNPTRCDFGSIAESELPVTVRLLLTSDRETVNASELIVDSDFRPDELFLESTVVDDGHLELHVTLLPGSLGKYSGFLHVYDEPSGEGVSIPVAARVR